MRVVVPIGQNRDLVFEDYGAGNTHMKVSLEDAISNSSITLGLCLKDDLKRVGRSV